MTTTVTTVATVTWVDLNGYTHTLKTTADAAQWATAHDHIHHDRCSCVSQIHLRGHDVDPSTITVSAR